MATKFALKELKILMPDGREISVWFDGNGKVTVGNGTYENPAANAFSLVQVKDCPFATPTCIRVCYVHRLEQAEKEVHGKYRHNSEVIREILGNSSYEQTAARAFSEWIRANCSEGFRWHVSGDIFSLQYAQFIRQVCDLTPEVPFWIYTRSFPYVAPLIGTENLVINLSTDEDNWLDALVAHNEFGIRLCYLTVDGEVPADLPDGSVIFPSHELRGRDLIKATDAPWWQSLTPHQRRMVCAADFFGQSEFVRCGPCRKCLK